MRIEQRQRTTRRVDDCAFSGTFWQGRDVIDLIDAQPTDDAIGLDDECAIALSRRRTGWLIQQSADIQHRKNCPMQIADTAECGWSGRHGRYEPQRDDLTHPSKLHRVTCRTDREHDNVSQLWHGASIP